MDVVGRVESVWRYPVKSMRGEKLKEAFLGFAGLFGDRFYAFRSSAAPVCFPYLTGREQERMVLYQPRFRHPEIMTRPTNLDEAEALGSGVTPIYPETDERMVDIETPGGEVFQVDDPRLIAELRRGIPERHELTLLRSDRAMTDCRPISIFALQTVRQLSNEIGFELDKRRFRANIYIELESGAGFGENAYIDRTLRIGDKARVTVLQRDQRCKMTTLDPDTAKATPEIMRLLARSHDSKAGVYAAVLVEGMIHCGDKITVG